MANLKVLDVSSFNPDIDYSLAAKNIDGVILRIGRTGWGSYQMAKDTLFETHYASFKAQGTEIGGYYYSCADTVERAKKEAQFVLACLKGKQFGYPVYYDVENQERQGLLTKSQITAIAEAFCGELEKAGYFVGYYSYTAWLNSKFDMAKLSQFTLWRADYRKGYEDALPCDMLQYTGTGKLNGVSGDVDLNTCYRDFPSLIKAAGLNGFSKPTTPESPDYKALYKAEMAKSKRILDGLRNLVEENS